MLFLLLNLLNPKPYIHVHGIVVLRRVVLLFFVHALEPVIREHDISHLGRPIHPVVILCKVVY